MFAGIYITLWILAALPVLGAVSVAIEKIIA